MKPELEKMWKRAQEEYPYPPEDKIEMVKFYLEIIYDYIREENI